jgi:hypothetical protein
MEKKQTFPVIKSPSSFPQRILIVFLSVFAALIAFYMTLYQWNILESFWDPIFNTGSQKVLHSDLSLEMSHFLRMPDALFGCLAYLSDALFAIAGSQNRWYDRPWLVLLFGFDVIPLGLTSIILVACQGIIVGHFCFLCLVTAAISTLLIFLAYQEVLFSLRYLIKIKRQGQSHKLLWNTFWGKASPLGYRIVTEMMEELEQKKNKD